MSLLAIERLGVDFHLEGGRVQAVRDASLSVEKGETVALVGESGSGKSVTALSVMQLLPYPRASHPHGSIRFAGEELVGAPPERLLDLRGGRAAIIFQEPMTSLNPLHSIERQISESLMLHREVSRQAGPGRAPWSCCASSACLTRNATQRLAAPTFRGAAPARDDRHGPGQRSGPADRRRADHRP